MSVVLLRVPGFGAYPDGRLRAGPFRYCGVADLHMVLEACGLRVGDPGDTGMVSMMADGVMLSASGAGVRGYFLDSEGLEVSESDLDRFLLSAVPAGAACNISGHWSPDPQRSIASEAVAVHDGDRVSWSVSRVMHFADGRRKTITRSAPIALSLAHG